MPSLVSVLHRLIIHTQKSSKYIFLIKTCNSSCFNPHITEYSPLSLDFFLIIWHSFETSCLKLTLAACGLDISNPYLILLALTIRISNLSLTGTLRICLSIGVLLESRFALQCLLVFKVSCYAHTKSIHNLPYCTLRHMPLTYVGYPTILQFSYLFSESYEVFRLRPLALEHS